MTALAGGENSPRQAGAAFSSVLPQGLRLSIIPLTMKRTAIWFYVLLAAYACQIIGTLVYSGNELILSQHGVSVYNRKVVRPISYFPLVGIVFTYLHKYNALSATDGIRTVVYEYESWDEESIDFASFRVEVRDRAYEIYGNVNYNFGGQRPLIKLEWGNL